MVSVLVSCSTATLQASSSASRSLSSSPPRKFTKLHGNLIRAAALGLPPVEPRPAAAARHICDDLQPDTSLPPSSSPFSVSSNLPCFGSVCKWQNTQPWGQRLLKLSQYRQRLYPGDKQYLEVVSVFYFLFSSPLKMTRSVPITLSGSQTLLVKQQSVPV